MGADDGGAGDHHAGGTAVVADGEVQPVGLQGVLLAAFVLVGVVSFVICGVNADSKRR